MIQTCTPPTVLFSPPSAPSCTRPVESTETLMAVIESLKRDRRLALVQADLALARLAHAQKAGTWQVIEADIDEAKTALASIRVRVS